MIHLHVANANIQPIMESNQTPGHIQSMAFATFFSVIDALKLISFRAQNMLRLKTQRSEPLCYTVKSPLNGLGAAE